MSEVRCSSCGGPKTQDSKSCPCGGRWSRACPACAFANSTAKNYCDRCGQDLSKPARPAAPGAKPPRSRPPDSENALNLPATGVFHVRGEPPPPPQPKPRRARPPEAARKKEVPPPARTVSRTRTKPWADQELPIASTLTALALLVLGGLLYALWFRMRGGLHVP